MGTQRWAGSHLTQHSFLLFPRIYHSAFWESLLPSVATATCLNPDHSLHYHLGSCQFALCLICIFSTAAALKGPSAGFSLPQDTSFLPSWAGLRMKRFSFLALLSIQRAEFLCRLTCFLALALTLWLIMLLPGTHLSLSLVLAFLVSLSLLFVFFKMKSYAFLQTHTPWVSQVHTNLSDYYPPILPHLSFAVTWV